MNSGGVFLLIGGLTAVFLARDTLGSSREMAQSKGCSRALEQVHVPAGEFWMGSTSKEREYAYGLDKGVTRSYGWYEKETRRKASTNGFCIDRFPVTNSEYKEFIEDTGRPEPFISRDGYQRQGFLVHPYEKVKGFLWLNRTFPADRENHPVTLVSHDDATSYCNWKGQRTQRRYRLPNEPEWEKAARGTDGRIFPWGNSWNPKYLNSGDRYAGTTPVNRFPQGKSPYGLYDMSGNVFEWTLSGWDETRVVLKSCSWDDLPGTCRAAMRHGRPSQSKHILIGFRCAAEMERQEKTPQPE